MSDDVKRPRSGAIGGHIGAGATALFVCAPLIYALIGLAFPLKPERAPDGAPKPAPSNDIGAGGSSYRPPVRLANLENQSIKESSGIAASRRNAGVLWTHNDSGDGPFIF